MLKFYSEELNWFVYYTIEFGKNNWIMLCEKVALPFNEKYLRMSVCAR